MWKKSTAKNERRNSNQNLGLSRPKSTLQGSGLDILGFSRVSFFFLGGGGG